MAEIITSNDLASYLRQDTDAAMDGLVELANGIVSEAFGAVPDPTPISVKAITLEVAARAFRNPGGFSSETIDDYTYRLPDEARRAGVFLTATERAELAGVAAGGSTRRAYTGWLA